ncbi:glycosyltransferase family 10 domain-containing protein [Litchfieldella rifensis]|uniref:Glycosyltransferase family 10 domain-containing protein n=1 Tax=Litchfieldella rifensis TaxID=762643 RepID=A0ABV7LU53_9GAMM
MINVYPMGQAHRIRRQPLAYASIYGLLTDHVNIVNSPDAADILLFAHPEDVSDNAGKLIDYLQDNKEKTVVLLSEEPFWDTVWGVNFMNRHQCLAHADNELSFIYLNHHTSPIFQFSRIPYYLLAEYYFYSRYSYRFSRNARLSITAWAKHFQNASLQAVFMARKRTQPRYSVRYDKQSVYGLSAYRTELADLYCKGEVLRQGTGWQEGVVRQDSEDWHLEKLLALDFRCRFVSALENTHQHHYVSEKFFDAFAVGAVPIYYADRQHSVHGIVPCDSWVNIYDLPASEAAVAVDQLIFDKEFLRYYADSQMMLADLFNTPRILIEERERLASSLLKELTDCLSYKI